ncbi:cellulose 1,4-beta-cellobiosidase [Streptomyces sp. AV19]|uniref:PA14 domain-containing protein n=1 Tax=Streptomyces sp. AV19 TaxID=2793068 RepID=UPI0018FEC6F7|nr:PA14 domain-containing protein [Streptomyces sp. AV19]MBH1934629.1 cellulose 1,4-beta-cellobiosidase [Streptomyces sp. AV19]MDG4530834.1 PA14 domain-containing protein [Streptomyces sp. AV19]
MLRRTAVRRASATALVLTSAALGLTVPAGAAQAAPVTCAPGVWKAEFFPNTTFRGTPRKTACDNAIAENYGTGAPAGLPRDNFGVRWTTTRDFGSGGPFTLTAEAADGIRVYLDNVLKIDLWKDVPKTRKKAVRLTVPKGKHTLRVNYAAFTGPANVKFTYAPVTSKADDKVKPLAPARPKASYDAKSGRATLGWGRNNELDLAGYQVHRRVLPASGKAGAWAVVSGKKPLTGTSFTDRPKSDGSSYAYAVTALDKAGNASARSAEARIGTAAPAPAAPAGLAVSGDYLEARLTWAKSKETGLAGYRVWRRDPRHDWQPVLTTRETSATDTPVADGTAYEYAVTALGAGGKESGRSASVAFASVDRSLPQAPLDLAAFDTPPVGVALYWRIRDDATHFRVYGRDEDGGADFTCLGSVQGEDLKFLDRTIRPGRIRSYYVTAVNDQGVESGRSKVVRNGDEPS